MKPQPLEAENDRLTTFRRPSHNLYFLTSAQNADGLLILLTRDHKRTVAKSRATMFLQYV